MSALGSLEDVLPSTDILKTCKTLLRCLFFFIFCHLTFFCYDLDFLFLLLKRIYTCILISYIFLYFYLRRIYTCISTFPPRTASENEREHAGIREYAQRKTRTDLRKSSVIGTIIIEKKSQIMTLWQKKPKKNRTDQTRFVKKNYQKNINYTWIL